MSALKENDILELTREDIRRDILIFSWPIIAESMLMSMISIMNSIMVGHLGKGALSSVGLTNQPVFIANAVFQSFNIGATALISRAVGGKKYDEAKEIVVQTMIMSVFFGVILSVVCFIFSRELVVFMGAQNETIVTSTMYMRYMSAGMLFSSISTAVAAVLRGAGDSKSPMYYNIAANIVNVLLGFILINGLLGIGSLGLEGAAISATVAKFVACIASIYMVYKTKLKIALDRKTKFILKLPIIKRVMNIGISSAGEQFALRFGFVLYTKIVTSLGDTSIAAHQIISNITGLASNVVGGLATASSSYTGRWLGAKKSELAEKYVREINFLGLIFSLAIGATFTIFRTPISMIFTKEHDVISLSAAVLIVGGLITFPQNYGQIFGGSLRGAGDTKYPLYSSLIGVIFVRVLLANIFVKLFGWGLVGAWLAAFLDQSVRSILMYRRFKRGNWKDIKV